MPFLGCQRGAMDRHAGRLGEAIKAALAGLLALLVAHGVGIVFAVALRLVVVWLARFGITVHLNIYPYGRDTARTRLGPGKNRTICEISPCRLSHIVRQSNHARGNHFQQNAGTGNGTRRCRKDQKYEALLQTEGPERKNPPKDEAGTSSSLVDHPVRTEGGGARASLPEVLYHTMTAEEFKTRRKLRFKSQQAAADFYEVSKSLIDKYERGVNPIRKIHAMAFDATLPKEATE